MEKRIWLITGISSGIGKALAEEVIGNGDFVIGTLRDKGEVMAFNKKNEGRAMAILLDITDHDAIENVVKAINDAHGKIDVLVNNAGMGFMGAVEETSIKEAHKVFEVNFFGVMKLTQAVLPLMRERKSGHIVQISSHGGVKAFAGFGIYNASKFALEGMSEALAQEIAPLGIKLSIIEPGPFRTGFAGKRLVSANTVISDYAETAGAFRTKLSSVDGRQEGDPVKAAKAIVGLVNSENPTLRMPLGQIALKTIGMKLASVQNDLEAHRSTAENAIFN